MPTVLPLSELVSKLRAVETSQGPALDQACAPRVHRREAVPHHETTVKTDPIFGQVTEHRTWEAREDDESLRERWYRTFDVRVVDLLVENVHMHEQVNRLQARCTELLEEARELRKRPPLAPEVGYISNGEFLRPRPERPAPKSADVWTLSVGDWVRFRDGTRSGDEGVVVEIDRDGARVVTEWRYVSPGSTSICVGQRTADRLEQLERVPASRAGK